MSVRGVDRSPFHFLRPQRVIMFRHAASDHSAWIIQSRYLHKTLAYNGLMVFLACRF